MKKPVTKWVFEDQEFESQQELFEYATKKYDLKNYYFWLTVKSEGIYIFDARHPISKDIKYLGRVYKVDSWHYV